MKMSLATETGSFRRLNNEFIQKTMHLQRFFCIVE